MKPMIESMKTRASRISVRTIAVMLCFVMLVSAIGAGTVLTAIAQEFEPAGGAATAADAADSSDAAAPKADDKDDAGDAEDTPAAEPAEAPAASVEENTAAPGKNLVDSIAAHLLDDKEDFADTGADVDIAETGTDYKMEEGARFYFNAYDSGFTGSYYYMAIIWNNWKNYSVVKMDHIANSDWYTCVTTDDNIYNDNSDVVLKRSDAQGACFFSSDSSSWATINKYFEGGAHNDIKTYCGGGYTEVYGADINNNHVYYFHSTGSHNITRDNDYNGGDYLAAHSSVTETKTSWQKASVYVSNNGTTYTYSTAAGEGGEVQVGSYYWATNFTTSAKGFAPASSGTTRNSQYDNAVVTSWVTLKVTEVYDGWHFMGWYDSSGNPAGSNPTDTTNYYQITSTSTFDVHAHFLKPVYNTVIPKSASTISNKIIINKGNSQDDVENIYIYGSGDNDGTVYPTRYHTTNYWYTDYKASDNLNGIVRKWTSWDTGAKLSGDITKGSKDYTDNIYYWSCKGNENNGYWDNLSESGIVHLGAASLSADKTSASIGDEVTLTTTDPTTGTFRDSFTYCYYYSTNGSTWYGIAIDSTENTVKFYPPENGLYEYKVAVTDDAGFETVVANSSNSTVVGVTGGKYITGTTNLVGGSANWSTAPPKGLMTRVGSTDEYKLTFGNLPADTYQFRVTTLNANGTVSWETGSSTPAPTGSANPTIVSTNNIQFVLSEKKQVTITYSDSTKAVSVDVADVQAIDVVVYAGVGGFVEVTYGSAVTEIPEGKNMTIKVAYGEKIDLEATSNGGYTFSKWYKNLTSPYIPDGKDGDDPDDINSLEEEVITKRTVYVASFTSGSNGWVYSDDRSAANPEISGDASSYKIIYSGSDTGVGRSSGTPNGNTATYNSGSDYWCDLSPIFGNPPSDPTRLYIALANGTGNNNMVGDSGTKINGNSYSDGNGPTITDSEGNTLFIVRKKHNSEVNNTIRYIEIDSINWTSLAALGVRAYYTGSGSVNYKFYYRLSGASSGAIDYVPSTNFYAKDGTITGRDQGYANLWFGDTDLSKSVVTRVTAVDGQVEVQDDHKEVPSGDATYHELWTSGKALKGSQITVTTTIPGGDGTTTLKYVDKNGNTGTCKPRDKYYVVGFSFNGYTPETYTWRADGVYTCTYTIPANMKETMLEITPIYFIRDEYATNTVMVYINGLTDQVKNSGWGNTLFLYPFYQYYKTGTSTEVEYSGQGENFGRYPGQPVVNNGGQLYMQIPLTDDGSDNGRDNQGNKIKGITINNGYNDIVHSTYCKHVNAHRQTYDYDDFAKIYGEKKLKNGEKYLHSIYFSFKYFTENTSSQHRSSSTTSAIDGNSKASRYNDLLVSPNILDDNTSGNVAAATLTTAGDNSTGWEDLTDALGNKVDIFGNKVTNASAEPLRVFSLGYEYNNAGRWATEWAVYHLNGENYELISNSTYVMKDKPDGSNQNKETNSSIVPSALVMNSASSFANYTAIDNDASIQDYAGLYTNISAYAGVPVKICYEHEIPDGCNPKNYRSDGRWNYTTVNDYVKSDIVIEYTDKNGADHFYDPTAENPSSPDVFTNTNQGTVTGCKAYFTNSEYYGAVESSTKEISNTEKHTFKAEAAGSYEFVGWYMYDANGKMSKITDAKEASTLKSGNFVLAARFKYVAEGSLTISTGLDAASLGCGTAYLGVTVINGDKETVLENVNSYTGGSITIDKSVINSSSNYDIRIELKTVPNGENAYASYACKKTISDDSKVSESRTFSATDPTFATQQSFYNSSANISNTVATYTINVKRDIYNSSTTQEIKTIEYVTTMTPVTYHYDVKYWYVSRQYGKQAMTKSGNLTVGQIEDTTLVNKGTLNALTNKKLENKFLQQIMPHESNFNEQIVWNFDNSDNVTQRVAKEGNTYTFTVEVGVLIYNNNSNNSGTSTQPTTVVQRTGVFTVPYAQTGGVAGADGEGKTAKAADTTFELTTDYNDFFYTSGTSLVIAPTVIYETVEGEEKTRNFKYWEISQTASSRGDAKVIGKCYFPEFNYRALDNYSVKAVYTESDEDTSNYKTLYASEAGTTSIAFIGNSRNQWNNNDKGDAPFYAGDLIYNDFILSFKPQNEALLSEIDDAECGMIIQRLKEIETNASGTNAKTLQEYAKDYSSEALTAAKAAALAKVDDTNTDGYTQIKVAINKSNVNNKNRCHYSYSMYNSAQKTSSSGVTATNNCKYLYRAYSYMKIGDGEYIISDEPTYFYMYDIANE